MKQTLRVIVAALALVLLVAGTAFATRSPQGEAHRAPAAASHQPSSPDENGDASESPEPSESEAPKQDATDQTDTGTQLTDAHAQALVDLLKAQGIDATADELKTLAAKYGVGGAVRLEAWAQATGKSVDDLAAMFDGGMGWGQIAHQLEQGDPSLHLSPGLGWILGHGHGNPNAHAANAPGQAKKSS